MRFEERDLNECELFLAEIQRATNAGKRISKAYMTQAEYDAFYQVAMNVLPIQESSNLINNKAVLNVEIVIEEPKKKKEKQ